MAECAKCARIVHTICMSDKTLPQTVDALLTATARRLTPTRITCAADREVGRLEAELLLGHVLDKEKTWLLVHGDMVVRAADARCFHALVRRRKAHEPVAYLIGERLFYGRSFLVNRHVLIPRPETELMIERALRVIGNRLRFIAWDIGTGSGAIAVSLAAEAARVPILATDTSVRALAVARRNARRHNVSSRITFLKNDLLQPAAFRWITHHAVRGANHLVILANLPYLPDADKRRLAPDVVRYEPRGALFSGPDGLTLIRRLLNQLSRHVPEWKCAHVTILTEFDPPQTAAIKKAAHAAFPSACLTVHPDLAGRDRMLEISL